MAISKNPKFGRRSWVKLWVNEWLDGTTRFEMTDAQRAFWIDLLAMAGRSRFPGFICAGQVDGNFVGYPLNKYQALMTEPFNVDETLALFERTGKIKITITAQKPTKLVMLELVNWSRYQSEYQRQKGYRKPKLQESDSPSYNTSNKTEVEVDVEVEDRPPSGVAPAALAGPLSEPSKSYKDMQARDELARKKREEKYAAKHNRRRPSFPKETQRVEEKPARVAGESARAKRAEAFELLKRTGGSPR